MTINNACNLRRRPDLDWTGAPANSVPGAGPGDPLPGVGSVAWKIHREVVLLLGWGRAILLQFAHPLVACGVVDHSSFRAEHSGHLRRLYQTLDQMLRLTFGTAQEADRIVRDINAIHDRIHGRLREPAGAFPVGAPYSAHDPALLCWVHATLVDSQLLAYELYVGALTLEEKDRYCEETSGMESLLGMPAGSLPRSVATLHSYLEGMLASREIAVTDTARTLAGEVLAPPALRAAGPLLSLLRLPTVGLLPAPIREAYGLAWDSRRERTLRLSAKAIRTLLPVVPPVLRYWPSARAAFRTTNRRQALAS